MRRRIRHAFEAGDAGHVYDVCPSLALDEVDAVQVDTEGGATAAPRMRAAITLSRIATVTGYGFTMVAPCACRTPARLIEIPEICFSTYRSCSTRTVERSMRRPLAAMTSTTTPASASACMIFGKMLTWPAP